MTEEDKHELTLIQCGVVWDSAANYLPTYLLTIALMDVEVDNDDLLDI